MRLIDDNFVKLATEVVAPEDVPTWGITMYEGVASILVYEASAVDQGTDLQILGDMDISVSFGLMSYGKISNFSDSDGDTYTGELRIDEVSIDRSPASSRATFVADVGGNLTNDRTDGQFHVRGPSLSGGSVIPEGVIIGEFFGADAELLSGAIRAYVDTPDGTLIIWDNDDFGTPDGDAVYVAEAVARPIVAKSAP